MPLASTEEIRRGTKEQLTMKNAKPILCLDFDGVIHSYTSGWCGAKEIPDPPVFGAMEFIIKALDTFRVVIHSSRARYWGGIRAMRRWLMCWMINHTGSYDYADRIVQNIEFFKKKPPAMVTLDDRALNFDGRWPKLDDLLNFKPWNKKDV